MNIDNYREICYQESIRKLKRLVQKLKETTELTNPVKRELLFNIALSPYYSPDGDLPTNTGNILYRLSEFIPEEERMKIAVYPSEDGPIVQGGAHWDSLEDWRKEWASGGMEIPYFHAYTLCS